MRKNLTKIQPNDLKAHTDSVTKSLTNFIGCYRKGVYPYGYMDSWQRFNKTLFPDKRELYSNLTMEDMTDAGYKHSKRV